MHQSRLLVLKNASYHPHVHQGEKEQPPLPFLAHLGSYLGVQATVGSGVVYVFRSALSDFDGSKGQDKSNLYHLACASIGSSGQYTQVSFAALTTGCY